MTTNDSYAGLVLLFNTGAPVHRMAQLHAAECPMVHTANGKRVKLIAEDVAAEVEDLIEREYPVKRCKCCKGK